MFSFVVSSAGTVLRIETKDRAKWEALGCEVFDSYVAAASRFTGTDADKKELMYFEEI